MTLGYFPQLQLVEARLRLKELKKIRELGLCPKTEQDKQRHNELKQQELQLKQSSFTIKAMINLYLNEYIQDRYTIEGKLIKGARKPKGQDEVRRTLYTDVVQSLGEKPAIEVTRKNIIDVQAGNVLRELNATYKYAIGTGKIDTDFTNPAVLVKNSFRMAKVKLSAKKVQGYYLNSNLKSF